MDLIRQDRGTELRQQLREILATKNTLRHGTTGCIPIEIHRRRLLNRVEGISTEEEEKIIKHMSDQAVERTKVAAEKASQRWIRNHCVKIYEVGDKVWARQRIVSKRKGQIWQRTATIHKVRGNASYRLLWGENGGYDTAEKPFSVSLRYWSGNDLKPRIERSPECSDSESDPAYKTEESEDSSDKSRSPTPPRKPRFARRKHLEKGEEKTQRPPTALKRRAAITLEDSTTGRKRSASAVFAAIGVEKVDRSLQFPRTKRAKTVK